jgi:hypothetical protein
MIGKEEWGYGCSGSLVYPQGINRGKRTPTTYDIPASAGIIGTIALNPLDNF